MILPPDPEGMNDKRAQWAQEAVTAFQRVTRADDEDAVKDLLANLMHLCDRTGMEFAVQFDAALYMYREETDRLAA